MVAINAPDALTSDLGRLASALERLVFPDVPGETGLGATRDRLVRALRSYLLPRIEGPAAPLLVVFAGPTGTGKSTLLNSLSGLEVSETGPLRPTTREPVVLAADPDRYQHIGGLDCVTVQGAAPILESMTFVDTPDIDSTSSSHRAATEIMIDHADIVVFVCSASRYGDLVPWEVMRRAQSRGAPLIVVLNRVTANSSAAVADFRSLLLAEGLGQEILVVHEHHLGPGSSSVPSVAVRYLRRRLLAEVKAHREQSGEIMKTVLWSTLGEARDLISQADLATAETELVTLLLDELFSPDLDRLRAAMSEQGDFHIDLAMLSGLGSMSPRQARRRLRRQAPAPEQVIASRKWLESALFTTVSAELRETLHQGRSLSHDRRLGGPDAATHALLEVAIQSWSQVVASVVEGRRPDLASLLIEMSVLAIPGARSALEGVIPVADCDRVLDLTEAALLTELDPVYGVLREPLVSAVAADGTPKPDVDEARAALSEAVALSAFANA